MKKIFNICLDDLKKLGGYNTAEEIHHQPMLWKETLKIINSNKEKISNYINDKLGEKKVRIILTGAGTSAYVGDTAAPYLSRLLGVKVDSVATTDIVSSPKDYLDKETPTVLVSFARSGNSPESVAVYELAEKLVDNLSQVIITCNKDGSLVKRSKLKDKNLVVMMPEESNDKGFAMTSSFSCMLLTTLLIFDMKNLDKNISIIKNVIENAERILEDETDEILKLVKLGYDRVVYLGSSVLKGVSREAALKNLELTSGRVNTSSESILGFRHGPKSVVNDKTLIFIFMSNDEYTRKYDKDLLRELHNDGGEKKVVVLTYNKDSELEEIADKTFLINKCKYEYVDDAFIALTYIIYAQIFANLYSLQLGISPDNPRPDGTVNRVVKGVIIHQYNK